MTYKWNLQEAENYSRAFATLLTDEYFRNKTDINGAEILNLTESKQLNMFIIKELYDKWQTEALRFKSPYFNFDEPEVKQALADFMNTVSRHILINKENFTPLLGKATKKVLELYLAPSEHFENLMRDLPDFKLTADWIKNSSRFFKDYGWVLNELSSKLGQTSFVYANQAIEWVREIVPTHKAEEHDKALKDLSSILPLPFSVQGEPEKPQKTASFFDIDFNSAPSAPRPEPVKTDIPAPEPIRKTADVVEVTVEKSVTETFAPVAEKPLTDQRLNEKLTTENKTLNDAMTENPNGSTLSDFHLKRKIESINGAISLNQRFLFINNLFDGQYEVFNQALKELEASQSFNEAKEQMLRNYMPRFKWDLRSPEAEEFFDILKRRFN